jgi:hypothetical protein
LRYCTENFIENSYFEGTSTGPTAGHIIADIGSRYTHIKNNRINQGAGGHAIELFYLSEVVGNSITNPSGYAMSHGIYVLSQKNIISSNYVMGFTSTGIFVGDSYQVIAGNISESNSIYGIDSWGAYNTIIGNTLLNNGWNGISVGGTDNLVVDNRLVNSGTPSIHIDAASLRSAIKDNFGYNPQGYLANPYSADAGYLDDASKTQAYPSSNVNYTVAHSPKLVTIYGGTVTSISIDGTATGLKSGAFYLNPGQVLKVVWTGQPSSVVYRC